VLRKRHELGHLLTNFFYLSRIRDAEICITSEITQARIVLPHELCLIHFEHVLGHLERSSSCQNPAKVVSRLRDLYVPTAYQNTTVTVRGLRIADVIIEGDLQLHVI